LGPFLKAIGQCKFLFIAVDYFTKWVKVEAAASIAEREVCKFVCKNIITRLRVPRAMVFEMVGSLIPTR